MAARRAGHPLPPMSRNARAIYRVLRYRVPRVRGAATITYATLGAAVGVHHHSKAMDDALGEIVRRCRLRGFPFIAALVVRNDTGTPGAGYYPTAHGMPMIPRPPSALVWAREVVKVCATSYPARI